MIWLVKYKNCLKDKNLQSDQPSLLDKRFCDEHASSVTKKQI